MAHPPTVLVVPCYNEAARLDERAIAAWAQRSAPHASLLFVDDGSTDETPRVLERLAAAAPRRIRTLTLPRNGGKAEAVRRGMLAAAAAAGKGAAVGYWDADLATPLDALPEFEAALDAPGSGFEMVFGARVGLLGRDIRRRMARHYLGRVFATLASTVLSIGIYDTQCGAKLFRVTDDLAAALATPFRCRWTFDVELIARFVLLKRRRAAALRAERVIYELPLRRWTDVPSSKLGALSVLRMGLELAGASSSSARVRHPASSEPARVRHQIRRRRLRHHCLKLLRTRAGLLGLGMGCIMGRRRHGWHRRCLDGTAGKGSWVQRERTTKSW